VLYYEVKTWKFHRRRPDRGFGDAWPRFLRISGITSPCTPSERATGATPLISEETKNKTPHGSGCGRSKFARTRVKWGLWRYGVI